MTINEQPSSYGRVIEVQNNGIECPPDGFYTFEVLEITDPVEKQGFNPNDIDVQSRIRLELSGYIPDPEDDEDFDWNGQEVTMFGKWITMTPDKKNPGEYKEIASFKGNKSHTGKYMRAIYPDLTDEQWRDHKLNLNDHYGRKFQAPLTQNEKGYPKVGDPIPAKKPRRPQAAAPVAPRPQPTIPLDPSDEELFDPEEAVG
jgi:hypothetical protein